MKIVRLALLALFVIGCTATPTPEPTPTPQPLTAQGVIDIFNAAGLEVSDIEAPERDPSKPLPNSYAERLTFTVAEVAPRGGQVFTCESKSHCDALYAYFDMLKGIAGPYTYQSTGGTVVAQLNSGLAPETAGRFREIVEGIE